VSFQTAKRWTIRASLVSVACLGLVFWLDSALAPNEYSMENISPNAFKDGKVEFFIPWTGGDTGICDVDSEHARSTYPPGSNVLISQTPILDRCKLAPLPAGWKPPPMCCDLH